MTNSKKEITFAQYQTIDGIASGSISVTLPESLAAMGESVEYSANGKVLPAYEGKVSFEVTLADGTVTVVSGSIALWYDKKHIKAAKEAAEKAKIEAEKAAKEAEMQKQKEALLSAFTPEQIQALAALGMLK